MERLFGSRVRVRLLTAFLLHPGGRFHARALAKEVGAQYSAVWKELRNLERAGLLESHTAANTKAYRLDPSCPILPELRVLVLKTVGVGDAIRVALSGVEGVAAAFIYGSFAAGEIDESSDVDLMVIGRAPLAKLASAVGRIERELGREVNYVVSTPEDWRHKIASTDPFVMNVVRAPKVMLQGREDALREIAEAGEDQDVQRPSRRTREPVPPRGARSGRVAKKPR